MTAQEIVEGLKCIGYDALSCELQDCLTAAIAYIEAGTGEMPSVQDFDISSMSANVEDGERIATASLDACAPIISKLTSERDALKEILKKSHEFDVDAIREAASRGLVHPDKYSFENLKRVTADRDALQARIDGMVDKLRGVLNMLGAPTMDYAPEIKLKELEGRIQAVIAAINAAIVGEERK